MNLKSVADLKDMRVTVMGLGLNDGGVGVTNFLLKNGTKVIVTDLNSAEYLRESIQKLQKHSNLELVLGRHREEDFINTDIVIRNPAVPRHVRYLKIAEEQGIPIEMEASLFFKLSPTRKIVAVTGTKGKTTTTFLIYDLLKKTQEHVVLAGNMRISMVEQLESLTANSWVVLELSSFQIESLVEHRLSPYIGVYTNILQDHLDRYGDISTYAMVKKGLVVNQQTTDYTVINQDDDFAAFLTKDLKSKVCCYSAAHNQVTISDTKFKVDFERFRKAYIVGNHNYSNLLAAYTVGKVLGLSDENIFSHILKFKGVEHRLEVVKELNGVRFVNDTTATMPDAALAALKAYEGTNLIIILGGKDKNLDFTDLIAYINRNQIKVVLLDIENTATKIYTAGISSDLVCLATNNLTEAVKAAYTAALPLGIVLLSPGSASTGTSLFLHEFDRGERFRSSVISMN